MTLPPQYVCINCGHRMKSLFHKYTSHASVKPTVCEKCQKIGDKYIEYECIVVLLDVMLMSDTVYRHMLYNRDFKLHWKLSLVLLLIQSFALWRRKRGDFHKNIYSLGQSTIQHSSDDLNGEKGFYVCCLLNILDYITIAGILFLVSIAAHSWSHRHQNQQRVRSWHDLLHYASIVLKGVAIANFSKFFILPIMVWGQNTTAIGASLHHLLVSAHHLCSLSVIFTVVHRQTQQQPLANIQLSGLLKMKAAFVVLPMYALNEFIQQNVAKYLEREFL